MTVWFAYGDIQLLSPVTNQEREQKQRFQTQIRSEDTPIKRRLWGTSLPARLNHLGTQGPSPSALSEGLVCATTWLSWNFNEHNDSYCTLQGGNVKSSMGSLTTRMTTQKCTDLLINCRHWSIKTICSLNQLRGDFHQTDNVETQFLGVYFDT